MRLCDELVRLLSDTQHKRFLYVSADMMNLESVSNHVLAHVDLSQTDSLLYMVEPVGVDKLVGAFHIAFVDSNVEKDVASSVPLHQDSRIFSVNYLNGTIECQSLFSYKDNNTGT